MAETKNVIVDHEALSKLISESGILNPEVKVADLLSTTLKVASLPGAPGGVTTDSGDFFISRTYVYFHAEA